MRAPPPPCTAVGSKEGLEELTRRSLVTPVRVLAVKLVEPIRMLGPEAQVLGRTAVRPPPRARARVCSSAPPRVEVYSQSHRRVEEVWVPDQSVLVCPGVSSGPEVSQTSNNPEVGRPGPGQSGSQEPPSDASRRFEALLARIRAKQKANREQQAPPPQG